MTIIETPIGRIEGTDRRGHLAFRGIRFAEPPTGPRRYRPPVPISPWNDVYDATAFGPSAPQPEMAALDDNAPLAMPAEPTAEDCLFLNVYTPAADDGRRPVLFWIHGGGYVMGSGRVYDGAPFLAEHDVVVVTVNYRMGALGFMHVGHLESGHEESVNNGILDQICALEWTRDNVASFGGDPDNVLIFGESAGGTSTAMLLGCPRAEGLFHKAVVHSPHVDVIPVGDGHMEFTNRCIERLGGDPAQNGMETLRDASVEALVGLNDPDPEIEAARGLAFRKPDNVGFSPAIDGSLIPAPIAETIAARGAGNVPFMGGGCRHEGTLFANMVGLGDCTEDDAIALFEREGLDGRGALDAYEAFAPGASPREKLVYALTDTMFRNSMVRILDAAADAGATCWSWMCTFESDFMGGMLRATHAMELAFLWDWASAANGFSAMAGSNPPGDLGAAMRSYWVNFARTGEPVAPGEPTWPPYNTQTRPVLVLDTARTIEEDLDACVRRYWFPD